MRTGSIPVELKALPQWVGWKNELHDGKLSKIPKDCKNGRNASSTDSKSWCDFPTAVFASQRFQFDGPGFVFSDQDLFSGVDLDDCRNPDNGEIAIWAGRIIRQLNSYTEVSPSQTGVKIWVRGKIAGSGKKKAYESGEVEIYSRGRYFAVTGQRLDGTPETIESRQAELEALVSEIFVKTEAPKADANDTGFYRNWDELHAEARRRIASAPNCTQAPRWLDSLSRTLP